jgi:hypothetical protein
MIGEPVSNILPYAQIDFGIPTSFISVFFEDDLSARAF